MGAPSVCKWHRGPSAPRRRVVPSALGGEGWTVPVPVESYSRRSSSILANTASVEEAKGPGDSILMLVRAAA